MPTTRRALAAAPALVAAGLALYAYRELPGRPFAADDYQWLLNVRGQAPGELLARAFDASAQTHFFRPLVWLLIWGQVRLFGLDPAPFHAVSLGLHLLNALLLALLIWRLSRMHTAHGTLPQSNAAFILPCAVCISFVALHPAPFEAVVWVSAQSELLAAALLLAAMHLWLPAHSEQPAAHPGPWRPLLATCALALALLTKESAVIGAGLLLLLPAGGAPGIARRIARAAPPLLVTAAYLAFQAEMLARNEVVRGAGYGLGPQLLLNPLRTLGLVAAPLPGTQYGDAPWLPIAGGALMALWIVDCGLWISRGGGGAICYAKLALAVLLTLLPTAPFASPPDSRYTYLPVLAVAALLAWRAAAVGHGLEGATSNIHKLPSKLPMALVAGTAFLLLAWWAAGEVSAREARFAAATGPGGSLWHLAAAECAAARPSRVILVEPPLAPPHAEAIVRLACGEKTRPLVVGRDGVEDALRPNALVIAFPGGSARVEQRTANGER
ncbi:MAG TPA: hypothetical protein VNL77_05465 [Roseiflexaceae bacterium]|nr:hypothetical protein [Roseiflexaceae bacterium]